MVDREVLSFSVATTTPSQTSDVIYANCRMQVAVYVLISAVEKATASPYTLSESELDNIELMDYGLHGGWSYTDEPGEYAGSISSSAAATDPKDSRFNGDFQTKIYWVSTIDQENMNVGAMIYQPDGKLAHTHNNTFDSHVTLSGKRPITYTTNEVTVDKQHITSGQYTVEELGYTVARYNWDQDNYYFSTATHPLHKTELHWYDRTGHDNGHLNDSRLLNSWAYQIRKSDPKDLELFFIWERGQQATTTAGVVLENDPMTFNTYANITYNPRSEALCLTHLRFFGVGEISAFNNPWYMNTWFVVYDVHGNTGKFKAAFSQDHNSVVIQDYS